MILILDFGSQYTQLIARRVREANVYCEIHPFDLAPDKIRALRPRGIILSGGPASLYDRDAPDIRDEVLHLGCPVLGICYGLYVIAQHAGARSVGSRAREYGPATLVIDDHDALFDGIAEREMRVWMSHGDRVEALPDSLRAIAHSDNSPFAAFRSGDGR
ncbi:MAG TPA: glutamine-hydrolyzing GMP synthase, partial [Candidatus Binataceae bacterium]|nr:glutamine-hydrolyzing GMP synthase [Candidatus Binataceae bacterium]